MAHITMLMCSRVSALPPSNWLMPFGERPGLASISKYAAKTSGIASPRPALAKATGERAASPRRAPAKTPGSHGAPSRVACAVAANLASPVSRVQLSKGKIGQDIWSEL
jgi:hypothetical protein